jgi:hypothetical protein
MEIPASNEISGGLAMTKLIFISALLSKRNGADPTPFQLY